ncbi:13136_t:CDS:2, partial [Gigaspora margarita]
KLKHFVKTSLEEVVYLGVDLPVSVPEVIESHYGLKTLVKNNNKGLTNTEENLKQKEAKLSLRTVLEGLANADLKVLKNRIPEITKPEEPEPQFKNPKNNKVKIEMLKLNLDNVLIVNCYKNEIRVKKNKTPEEYFELVKSNNLDSQFDPDGLFYQYEIGLGKVYKGWKKKIKKLKRITRKFESKDLNELEKH